MSGPIVMAHALAELRYGIVAHQHESGFKCGYISAQTLNLTRARGEGRIKYPALTVYSVEITRCVIPNSDRSAPFEFFFFSIQ